MPLGTFLFALMVVTWYHRVIYSECFGSSAHTRHIVRSQKKQQIKRLNVGIEHIRYIGLKTNMLRSNSNDINSHWELTLIAYTLNCNAARSSYTSTPAKTSLVVFQVATNAPLEGQEIPGSIYHVPGNMKYDTTYPVYYQALTSMDINSCLLYTSPSPRD